MAEAAQYWLVTVRTMGAFVGRANELRELELTLEAVRMGAGATMLIAGEAGIGKTRLAQELASRARDDGFEVLLGRSIDLVGTELPFQPFIEALRPVEDPPPPAQTAGSQLQMFDETLAVLAERATSAPVLLVLEDLHWADTSTLDLVVYLAHNLDDHPVLLLPTYRADEAASTERMRRADGWRRSGSRVVLELGPLENEELAALLGRPRRLSPARGTDGGDPYPLRGQPVLRRGAARRVRFEPRAPAPAP